MRYPRSFLTILVLSMCAPSVFAEESAREVKAALVEEYISVTRAETTIEEALRLAFDQSADEVRDSLGYTAEDVEGMDVEEKLAYEKSVATQQRMMSGIVGRLLATVDLAELTREITVPIIDRYYSEADLRSLIAFARTPTGQKQIENQAKIAVETQNATRKVLLPVMTAVIEELQKEEQEAEDRANPAKKAMADIRVIATVVEAYATDEDRYPLAVTIAALASVVEPTYVRHLPQKDPWGAEYVYIVSPDGTQYRIISGGSDTWIDGSSRVIAGYDETGEGRENRSIDDDLVFQDGAFVAWAPGSGIKQ